QQFGVGGQRRYQGDLLPVALGVGARLGGRVQTEAIHEFGAAPRVGAATNPAKEIQDLAAGQAGPQGDVTRDVGQSVVEVGRLAPRVTTEQANGAGIVSHEAEQDTQRGGLSGTVGPEEAVHLSRVHVQVQPAQGGRGTEAFDESGDLYRGGGHADPSLEGGEPMGVSVSARASVILRPWSVSKKSPMDV